MDQTTTDQPGNAGDTAANPDSNGSAGAGAKPAPVYTHTKDDVTRITQREVAKVLAEKAELAQRLAAIEEEKRAAEEAKLSAAQRADLERKREREKLEAERETWKATAEKERALRHDTLRGGRASSLAASIAAQLANPGLLPHVEAIIAQRLVVEQTDAGERVVIRLGSEGDNEPLESGFAKFRDEHLAPFFKVATGSGAHHGAGGAGTGNRAALLAMSPEERIEAGERARTARR